MNTIKKIPVIGYLARIILGIIKFPKHLDMLYQQIQNLWKQETILRQEQEVLRQEQEVLRQEQEVVRKNQQTYEMLLGNMREMQQHYQDTQRIEVNELKKWNTDRMHDIRRVESQVVNLEKLNVNSEYVKNLNRLLSIHPTLWGNESRLHISDKAAVFTCMFNTNSGDITVGDYTFAGPGVCILAGSHDMQLTGLLRRDAEMTEGCDIVIGEGVWLASNCTILGPATIGDNAVVAAGAVVKPGTVIPEGTIYGGVPAKCIGIIDLSQPQDISNPAIIRALERNNGVLYIKGWTEKREILCEDKKYVGHFQIEDVAYIYSHEKKNKMFYQFSNLEECTIVVQVDNGTEIVHKLSESMGIIEVSANGNQINEDQGIHIIAIQLKSEQVEMFIAMLN